MRAEALKGHLDGLLLAALEPGPAHGFAIMTELRRRSEGSLDLEGGTLYPVLRRLEESGLITGVWTTVSGRAGGSTDSPGRDEVTWRPSGATGASSWSRSARHWTPRRAPRRGIRHECAAQ